MENNRSKEDYLERFLILEERGIEKIRAKDIVCSFSYSRASVSVAMKKLAEENLIKIDENSYITLTEKGRDIASSVYKRHKMLTSFLMMIGVDEKQAREDACKIEHDISEETFSDLNRFMKNKKIKKNRR